MIFSLYSYLFEHNNEFYLYNSETGLFMQVKEDLYNLLYNNEFDKIDIEIKKKLVQSKFIIHKKDIYNYYNEQKVKFMSDCYNNKHLHLIIVPTTNCNFSCPYCFEGTKNNTTISNEMIDNLISFIVGHKNAETLSLTWYGGEPLLAFDKIKQILHQINEKTTLKIKSQHIVTNGYLLTDDVINFLSLNKFQSMQITLDGTKDNHNKTRYLRNKSISTFDKIIENIEKLIKALPNGRISIRINVKKSNANDYSTMYKMLYDRFPHSNLYVYPGFIREETQDGCRMCYESMFDYDTRYAFYEKMHQKGVNVIFFPKYASKGCMVSKMYSYIIGPSGEIYKCWNDVNHPDKIIGNIQNKEITNKSLFYAYQEATPFEDEKCKNCFAFPICSGGCAWYRYKNAHEGKQFDFCTFLKDKSIIKKCLLKSLKKEEEKPKGAEIRIC